MSFAALILLIGYFLQRTAGHYDSWVVGYGAAYCAFVFWASRSRGYASKRDTILGVLALFAALKFSKWGLDSPRLIYAQASEWVDAFDGLRRAQVGFVYGLIATYFFWRKMAPYFLLALGVTTFLAMSLIPLISPTPFIDVFVSNTAAADYFLGGSNPYSQTYVDIYNGYFGYKPGFFYLPGLLLSIVPFRAIFGDIRYAFVVAHACIALCLWALGKGTGRRQVLAPALWLTIPVQFFVLEQAWIDTLLVAMVALLWLARDRQWIALSAVAAGLAISVKQYGFIFAILVAADLWRTLGLRAMARFSAITLGVSSAVILPFIVVDPAGFYEMTVANLAGQATRPDALNVSAWLINKFGVTLPGFIQAAISVTGLLGATIWVVRGGRGIPVGARLTVGALVAFGASFFFGKFAFCNYHYLLAGVACLGLASGLSRRLDFRLED